MSNRNKDKRAVRIAISHLYEGDRFRWEGRVFTLLGYDGSFYRARPHRQEEEHGDKGAGICVIRGDNLVDYLPITEAPQFDADMLRPRQKPPLGIKPRWIAAEHRCAEIADAYQRWLEAGETPPAAWAEELLELTKYLERKGAA